MNKILDYLFDLWVPPQPIHLVCIVALPFSVRNHNAQRATHPHMHAPCISTYCLPYSQFEAGLEKGIPCTGLDSERLCGYKAKASNPRMYGIYLLLLANIHCTYKW